MTVLLENHHDDLHDVRLATGTRGLIAEFNTAGVLTAADAHVATTLGRLCGESNDQVLLAAALAVRSVREGSVCLYLAEAHRSAADVEDSADLAALPWPEPSAWLATCAGSPLIAVGTNGPEDRPLRLVDGLLYLDRYWREEQLVRAELDARTSRTPLTVDTDRLRAALDRLFPSPSPDLQRLAVAASVTGWVTVVAGGPGTGKTTTVARLLAVLNETPNAPPRVALVAPTGKAAARMQEAVTSEFARLVGEGIDVPSAPPASTLHRLLGWRPDSHSRFRFNRHNHLPHDVVVVDETSMVSLTLMSRLLEAMRPDAQLVLVGDPDQLASVEAGAVLGDLVRRQPRPAPDDRSTHLIALLPGDVQPADEVELELRNDVVRLRTVHRYGGAIAELAEAIRRGRADDVMAVLTRGDTQVEFVETDLDTRNPHGIDGLRSDVVNAGRALIEAALAGDAPAAVAALEQHRLLCAHRRGPYGVARWSQEVERWLAAAVPEFDPEREWYISRPLIVTANDYELGLYNGDTGVIIDGGAGPLAAFTRGTDLVEVAPGRLDAVQTVHAMTIHRAQGSQFASVSVMLPPDSPLLTRELLYTAVTRARESVRVLASEASVGAAIDRLVLRASGLRERRADPSWPAPGSPLPAQRGELPWRR
jgi:exodeoxyribonuclease V alpha subunit